MSEKRLYTVKEAMEYLAISKSNLYKLVQAGQISFMKIGKNGTRFDKNDLDIYIESQKVKSN